MEVTINVSFCFRWGLRSPKVDFCVILSVWGHGYKQEDRNKGYARKDKMLRVFLDENLSEYFFYKENEKWVELLK